MAAPDDKQTARQFLASQQYMVVSVTLADGSPWAVPVRILRHEAKLLEWDSHVDSQHSRVIERDPRVMLLCYDANTQTGVYMTASVTNIERRDDGFARYRAEVGQAWLNDASFVKRPVEL